MSLALSMNKWAELVLCDHGMNRGEAWSRDLWEQPRSSRSLEICQKPREIPVVAQDSPWTFSIPIPLGLLCSPQGEVETEFREVTGTPKADDDPARTPWPGPRSGLRFVEAVSEMGLAL
ncbi:Fumarylacetoacetase [Manis pentadactyla]|nr:Fumarylacetoacetase [Manis pentadactyla]